jgi:hypothetical protein
MDDDRNKGLFVTKLLRRFAVFFSVTVLTISGMGVLVAHYFPHAQDVSTLLSLGKAGLPYDSILQITGLIFIISVFTMLLEQLIIKIRLLLRLIFNFLITLLTTSIFVFVFKWFPVNDPVAWFSFILSFVICYSIIGILTYLMLRLEGRKYNRLLANYKARHNAK